METDRHFHIYNRANGKEHIFTSSENYEFFLRKYKKYLFPVVETFCYCLMPNHFHFLVKVKSHKELLKIENYKNSKKQNLYVSKQFSNLFSSYTQAFNKQESRKGNLFMRPFKRKEVLDEIYFRKLMHYIHTNPVEAGLCNFPNQWQHSSYNSLISKKPTLLMRKEVLNYFDSVENFVFVHSQTPRISGIEEF
ncbi:transposase [Aequorivita lipolytica]|uniref:Transposase n=1 Tax=Aequorivita lipolytica TaxID=153267 RepID=A0A5C6YSY8_9FLAO|nr:transposase [Aequorivita lipolytica]TXD70182.1 transposase [Aequorivita lipolytica]